MARIQSEVQFFAGGVHNRNMLAIGQHVPKFDQVATAIRIDHGQIVGRRHLDQTQFRPERILRNKLRINADAIGTGKPAAQVGKLGGRGDRLVRHGGQKAGQNRGNGLRA